MGLLALNSCCEMVLLALHSCCEMGLLALHSCCEMVLLALHSCCEMVLLALHSCCVLCSLDYLKSLLGSKSRLTILEFFGSHCILPRARFLHRKWSCISRTLGDDMLAARCRMLTPYMKDRYFSVHLTTNIGDVKLARTGNDI